MTTHFSILDSHGVINPESLETHIPPQKLFKNQVLYWTDILKKNGNKTVLICTKTS